ncbi:uncharacterized protein METZ01_LOCUS328174 [marine metagenome]|uniref:Uncharacterized protein n=1 Tax=marine metagenome TaxID=408172 RepID=A0A382PRB0_9ZZZZ
MEIVTFFQIEAKQTKKVKHSHLTDKIVYTERSSRTGEKVLIIYL